MAETKKALLPAEVLIPAMLALHMAGTGDMPQAGQQFVSKTILYKGADITPIFENKVDTLSPDQIQMAQMIFQQYAQLAMAFKK
jgi:hypothetical protein